LDIEFGGFMVCRWVCLPLLLISLFIAFAAVGSTPIKNNKVNVKYEKNRKIIKKRKKITRRSRENSLKERIRRIRANNRKNNKKNGRKNNKNRKKLIQVTKDSRNLPLNPAIRGVRINPKSEFIHKRGIDFDGDGIVDRVDKCPKIPEDKDGVDDLDGCPE
jgi:hypothetical protein